MKKVKLLTIKQKEKEFYCMVYDPREIIKLIDVPKPKSSQKAQRPWLEKKVKDIAKYVAGRTNISEDKNEEVKSSGIIPNSPILNIKTPMRIVETDGEKFIELPETDEEIIAYFGYISIIDGQHRLISFLEKYRDPDFKDYESYEMSFNVFLDLTINEIRELFMITNDKQDKMESNVLKEMKKYLNLLGSQDDKLYDLVTKLNEESMSPLKGRIIIGGNKITNGLKLTQVTKILDKSTSYELICDKNESSQIQIISNYLKSWENVYNFKISNGKHTLCKVAGFRYIMYLFPYVCDILKTNKKTVDIKNITSIIKKLYQLTDGNGVFENSVKSMAFRAESSTINLAKENGNLLKKEYEIQSDIFDPFKL